VLGLEALSRGAAGVTFVDSDPRALQALRERLVEWRSQGGTVIRAEAQAFLAARRGVSAPATSPASSSMPAPGPAAAQPVGTSDSGPFGLVFLDPPFAAGLLPAVVRALESGGWLASSALVYVEAPAGDPLPEWPEGWELLRSGTAGAVGYHLLRREQRCVATGHP
jgi:16S rRNA (guanine966-N2)-methyltransferase